MSNEQSLDFLQNLSSTEDSLQKSQNQSTYSVVQPSQQPEYQQQPVYQHNTQKRVQQSHQQSYQKTPNQFNSSAPALDQQIIPPLQSGDQSQPVSVFTLLASHFSLIGERLKDISTNIETVKNNKLGVCLTRTLKHLKNGDVPNIDRSLDTLLDTILYVSNVLILLFKSIPELEHPER